MTPTRTRCVSADRRALETALRLKSFGIGGCLLFRKSDKAEANEGKRGGQEAVSNAVPIKDASGFDRGSSILDLKSLSLVGLTWKLNPFFFLD